MSFQQISAIVGLEIILGWRVADLGIDAGVNQGQVANAIDVFIACFTILFEKFPRENMVDGRVLADDILAGPMFQNRPRMRSGWLLVRVHVASPDVFVRASPAVALPSAGGTHMSLLSCTD